MSRARRSPPQLSDPALFQSAPPGQSNWVTGDGGAPDLPHGVSDGQVRVQVRNTFVEFGARPTPANMPITAPASSVGRLTGPNALCVAVAPAGYMRVGAPQAVAPAARWSDDVPLDSQEPTPANSQVSQRAPLCLSKMLPAAAPTTMPRVTQGMCAPPMMSPKLPDELAGHPGFAGLPPPPMMSPVFAANPSAPSNVPPPPSMAPGGLQAQQQLPSGSVIEVRSVAATAAMPRFAPPNFTITAMPTPKGAVPPPPMRTPVCATPMTRTLGVSSGGTNRLLNMSMAPVSTPTVVGDGNFVPQTPAALWPPTPY